MRPLLIKSVLKVALKERKPVIIIGSSGIGKCLGKGTKIIMFDGSIKNVEDIKVGDLLMGPDSKPREVTKLFSGNGPLYKVNQNKGISYITNDNHILSLKLSPRKKDQKHELINIPVKDFIKKDNIFKSHAKGWKTGVDWEEKETEIPPYLLGIWLGDGDKIRPMITTPDKEIINKMEKYAEQYNLSMKILENCGKAFHISLSGRYNGTIVKNELGISLKKCINNNEKSIPNEYLINSRQKRLELLAGIIDADGSLSSNCFDLTQKIEKLSKQITFLAQSLGFNVSLKPCEKICKNNGVVGTYYRMTISGNINEIPTILKRKQATKRMQIKNHLVTGITIEPIEAGNFYGFQLKDDRLFLLEDFTVTHNTDVVSQICGYNSARDIENLSEEQLKKKFPDAIPLILAHPVTSDPTDFKGFPFVIDGKASFIPFTDLQRLIEAKVPTVFFIDDLGQAPYAVQAALMQLIQSRRVNGHKVSEYITFIAASNERKDNAGVQGILEPVKGRFLILNLDVEDDDWVNDWAIKNNMPDWLIAMVRYFKSNNESAIFNYAPSKDMTNYPCPRNVARAGEWYNAGIPKGAEFEVFKGCCGETWARKAKAFIDLRDQLIDPDLVIAQPDKVEIPKKPDILYILCSAVSVRATEKNFGNILKFSERIPIEFFLMVIKDIYIRDPNLLKTKDFILWSQKNKNLHVT